MKKSLVFYKKTLIMTSIAISVLIVLASLPSVFASKTIPTSNIINEIKEHFVENFKEINSGSPLDWSPGFFLQIFILTLNLYAMFLENNSWFPGLTFIMAYLFVVLCILSLIEVPENTQILDLKEEINGLNITI
jgi:hypothetical protein